MKMIKYVISVVIIFLCFILSSELYQSYMQTFSNQFYFIEIDNDEREALYSVVKSSTGKYKEDVFAIERKDVDAFYSKIIIYTTDEMKNSYFKEHDITEGIKNSLFSGSTEIEFRPFEEIINHESITRFYFTGSKDVVSSIRKYINTQMATSYIHKEDIRGSEIIVYSIWLISFGFILLLTWLDIQFNKKSDFLKISMGSSVGKIIRENSISDLSVTATIFCFAYFVLKEKIFTCYRFDFACLVMISFMILNSLLYVSLLKYDYKEIIYGANINGKLLANTYLLKAAVLILLVISLSCNFTIIFENVSMLQPYNKVDKLSHYNSLMVTPTRDVLEDARGTKKLMTQLFLEAYLQDKVLLATSCAAVDEPIIVINEAALNRLVSNPKIFKESDADFIVYVPESKKDHYDDYDIEFAHRTTASNYFGLENYTYSVCEYGNTEVIYFDLREVSQMPLGFEMISNPIIVYCNISATQIKEILADDTYIDWGDAWTNILFELKDTSIFSKQIVDHMEEILFNGVVEQCNQYKAGLVRVVVVNSILSAILLVLSILLVSVIVKMEYLINSKEIALKKILGYSLLQRNSAIIYLNVFAISIAFITGRIIAEMYNIFSVSALCGVSLFVFLLDNILVLSNMSVAENKNTAHILKGGSL
ncbi:MAG: hypothetical protein IJ335_10675 [Lachnospiraceae bacterium]|nr:hypothetical protein [Lachnospiraceae bacterium]